MERISADNNIRLTPHLQRWGTARLISDLMNPLFLPPVVLTVTGWMVGLSGYTIGSVTGFAFLFYSLIPLAVSFYLLKKKRIASLDLPSRKARNPLFIYSIFSAFSAFLCFTLTVDLTHPVVPTITIVYLINLIIGSLVNLHWKMSIHTSALASSGAIFLGFSFLSSSSLILDAWILSLVILLLLLPLMIWARYRLSIHSLPELFGGAAAGFLLTVIELPLLNSLW